MMNSKLTREELANLEIGHTTVSRSLSKIITIFFLLCIFTVPIIQISINRISPEHQPLLESLVTMVRGDGTIPSPQSSTISAIKDQNNQFLSRIEDFEKQLEEDSFLRSYMLAPGQRILLTLGYGNEKVYPGKDSWLFYRPDMDYLMGPGFLDLHQLNLRREEGKGLESMVQPDPLPAIIDFHDQLAKRGIKLILMPTPIKASIHPEFFSSDSYHPPLQNRSWSNFLSKIEQKRILMFDPAPVLVDFHKNMTEATYLKTDTHWRPEAMTTVAHKLADFIQSNISFSNNASNYLYKQETLENLGDLYAMLRMSKQLKFFKDEKVQLNSVVTQGAELWRPIADAEILLLGDSFSNIYSLFGMGWGEGAGLGEQLSYALQQPVDVILQNDAGSFATRQLLAKELAHGRDRLSGKKILIWQFACRELTSGNWKKIAMDLHEKPVSDFYTPLEGEYKTVDALVLAVSSSPVPGSVPYQDNVLTLHLDDISDIETGEEYGQALVYGFGMQKNILSLLAKVRPGDSIKIRLVDWDMVQAKYSSYRRTTLDDEMIELELPVWGDILP